jgi:hypothetical protein
MQYAYFFFDSFESPQSLEVALLNKHEGPQLRISLDILPEVTKNVQLEVRVVKQVALQLCYHDDNNQAKCETPVVFHDPNRFHDIGI